MGLLEKATQNCLKCAFRKCCDYTILEWEQMKALHKNLAKDVCLYEAFTAFKLVLLGDTETLQQLNKWTITEVLEDCFVEMFETRLQNLNLNNCNAESLVKIRRIYLTLADMTLGRQKQKRLQNAINAKFATISDIFCKKTDI